LFFLSLVDLVEAEEAAAAAPAAAGHHGGATMSILYIGFLKEVRRRSKRSIPSADYKTAGFATTYSFQPIAPGVSASLAV
jgi:hypothetical protein